MTHLSKFRGSLNTVLDLLGIAADFLPYVDDPKAGIKLSPGIDLSVTPIEKVLTYYPHLEPFAEDLNKWGHIRGSRAVHDIDSVRLQAENRGIKVNRDQVLEAFPDIAGPTWDKVCAFCPILMNNDSPKCVHTAILSFAYGVGTDSHFFKLAVHNIHRRNWPELALAISKSYDTRDPIHVCDRRKREAELILDRYPVSDTRYVEEIQPEPEEFLHDDDQPHVYSNTRILPDAAIFNLYDDQVRFVHELLAEPKMNKASAFRKVRPLSSPKSASVTVSRWMQNNNVLTYLRHCQNKRMERFTQDADWVLSRLVDNVVLAQEGAPILGNEGQVLGYTSPELGVANAAIRELLHHFGLTDKVSGRDKFARFGDSDVEFKDMPESEIGETEASRTYMDNLNAIVMKKENE